MDAKTQVTLRVLRNLLETMVTLLDTLDEDPAFEVKKRPTESDARREERAYNADAEADMEVGPEPAVPKRPTMGLTAGAAPNLPPIHTHFLRCNSVRCSAQDSVQRDLSRLKCSCGTPYEYEYIVVPG